MPFTWACMLSFINISIIIVLNWRQKQGYKVGYNFLFSVRTLKNFFENNEINLK